MQNKQISDESFNDIKKNAMQIFLQYDNKYWYVDEKNWYIQKLKNVWDNWRAIISLLDQYNQKTLFTNINETTKKEITLFINI